MRDTKLFEQGLSTERLGHVTAQYNYTITGLLQEFGYTAAMTYAPVAENVLNGSRLV